MRDAFEFSVLEKIKEGKPEPEILATLTDDIKKMPDSYGLAKIKHSILGDVFTCEVSSVFGSDAFMLRSTGRFYEVAETADDGFGEEQLYKSFPDAVASFADKVELRMNWEMN